MRRIEISQDEAGWVVEDGRERHEYPTAAEALSAVKAASRIRAARLEAAGRPGVDIFEIEWHPKTTVGTVVVSALVRATGYG